MLKNNLTIIWVVILIFGLISISFAADAQLLTPKADIPPTSALSVSVSKIVGNTWTAGQSSIDFGSLFYSFEYKSFIAACYYAIDVGVSSNALNWEVKHETTSMSNGSETMDENINVVFMKQLDDRNAIELLKVNFAESNGKIFNKSQLTEGWLRIYYGLATGKAGGDAPNAKPIGASKTFGNYQGTVKITMTEN